VIRALTGTPLVIIDPAPEVHHDAFAYQYHELGRFLELENILVDKGYLGLDLMLLMKGDTVTEGQTVLNHQINCHKVS